MNTTPRSVIPIVPAEVGAEGAARYVSMYEQAPKVYPRAIDGWFARWRWALVGLTQAVFYGLPWLKLGGQPAMLFDLEARRFHVLGLVLYPQDFIYLSALLVIAALALFFFTAVAGRLWCGYACPQTVYTEIFLWVERRLEGERSARLRLDQSPWNAEKVARKGGKHLAWTAIGLVTGFTFVGYFTPIRTLAASLAALTVSPWELFWILFYGGATYGNAGWLREQVCKYMCPYARFQSALIDADSLIISYDAGRGEARGPRRRDADRRALGLGDCIDCTLCLQVCPTGIDIRNGLQNECIGCAACIDACNGVMDKMGYARGLIRYATANGVAGGWSRARMLRRALRPRVLIYGAVLVAVSAAFVTSLALRRPFQVDVMRDRAALARIVDDGRIENVYRLQVQNSSDRAQHYRLQVEGLAGLEVVDAPRLSLPPAELGSLTLRLQLPPEAAAARAGHSVPIVVEVLAESDAGGPPLRVREKSTFFVPR